jgi:hypothetical protein
LFGQQGNAGNCVGRQWHRAAIVDHVLRQAAKEAKKYREEKNGANSISLRIREVHPKANSYQLLAFSHFQLTHNVGNRRTSKSKGVAKEAVGGSAMEAAAASVRYEL